MADTTSTPGGWVRFPASDLPGIIGLAIMVVLIMAAAKRVPFVKTLV